MIQPVSGCCPPILCSEHSATYSPPPRQTQVQVQVQVWERWREPEPEPVQERVRVQVWVQGWVCLRVRGGLMRDLARRPPLPGEVARAWNILTPQQRAVLVTRYPTTVGQLNGLPPADRVAANRLLATRRLAEAQTELAQLQARLGALPTLLNKYSPTVSQPQRVALNASIADL